MKKLIGYFLMGFMVLFSNVTLAQATPEGAKEAVEEQADLILKELRENQSKYQDNPQAFRAFVNEYVAPNLAFERMAEIALGRHLQAVRSEGKFGEFESAFRSLLTRVYSSSWENYINGEVRVVGLPTVDKYNRARVRAQVIDNQGKRDNIEFALWYNNNKWQVYDATFANVSLISGYRNTFDSEIQQSGIDALIAKMKTMD